MKSAARWVTSSTDCDLVSLRVLTTGNRIEQRGGRRACSPGARVAWGAGGRRPRGNAVYLNETGLAALYDLCVMTVPFLGNRAARATTLRSYNEDPRPGRRRSPTSSHRRPHSTQLV